MGFYFILIVCELKSVHENPTSSKKSIPLVYSNIIAHKEFPELKIKHEWFFFFCGLSSHLLQL